MAQQKKPPLSFKMQLIAWAGIFGFFFLVAVLWHVGVFNAAGKAVVDHAQETMRKETERQQNQPKTVIMKDGERYECKKVLEQGQYWGLTRTDGKFSAVKKEDVKEIVETQKVVEP